MDQTSISLGPLQDTGQENDAQQIFTLLCPTVVDVRKNTTEASRTQCSDR